MFLSFLNKNISRFFLLILFFSATSSVITESIKKTDQDSYCLILENDFEYEEISIVGQDFSETWNLAFVQFQFSDVIINKTLFNFLYYSLLSIDNLRSLNPFFLDIPPPVIS